MSLLLVVNDMEAIPPIRELLVPAEGKGATVCLTLKQGESETVIELPGKYQHSTDMIDRIRSIKGIVSAEEMAA